MPSRGITSREGCERKKRLHFFTRLIYLREVARAASCSSDIDLRSSIADGSRARYPVTAMARSRKVANAYPILNEIVYTSITAPITCSRLISFRNITILPSPTFLMCTSDNSNYIICSLQGARDNHTKYHNQLIS